MKKNIITNKITPCCGLPFSVVYWWVSNLTLNSEADRNFILSKIGQNGTIAIDGWKVLINSGTLEADASLTKSDFLAWFDCEKQPSCEQLKLIIEGYKMGSWVGDLNEIRFENVLGSLKITDTAPTTAGLYRLADIGTYTNLGGLVTTAGKINDAYFNGTTWSLIATSIPQFSQNIRVYEDLPNGTILNDKEQVISNNLQYIVLQQAVVGTDLPTSDKFKVVGFDNDNDKSSISNEDDYPLAVVDDNNNIALKVNTNGETDLRLSQKSIGFFQIYNKPNGLKYSQIGDSITALDNHTGGGNFAGNGYGKIIRNALNITYANHYCSGQNGWSAVDYATWITNVGGSDFPTNHDLYTVFLCTNDWGQCQNIGTMSDYINNTFTLSNKTSFGAYRKIIDQIIGSRAMSMPQVILITPMHRGLFGFGGDINTKVLPDSELINGNRLEDFANMVKEIAEYEGFACLDLFNDGIVPRRFLNMDLTWDASSQNAPSNFQDILYDNLHPTEKGHKLIGAKLLAEILKNISQTLKF